MWAGEPSVSFKGGSLGAWSAAEQSPWSSRTEPPAAGKSGDQHSMEKHLGVWSSAISTAVTKVFTSYALNGGVSLPFLVS